MQTIIKKVIRPILFTIAVVLLLNFFGYFIFQGDKGYSLQLKNVIHLIGLQKEIANHLPSNTTQYISSSQSLQHYQELLLKETKDLTIHTKDENQVFLSSVLENYNRSYNELQDALMLNHQHVDEAQNNFLIALENLLHSFQFWSQNYYYTFNSITFGKLLSLILASIILLYLTIEPIIRNYRSNKSNLQLTKTELLREKLFLSSILNSQTNFILRLNSHLQLNYVNPAFINRFKYDEKNIHHLSIYDLVQPKDFYKCRQILEECIRNPQTVYSITLELPIVGEENKVWTQLDFINLSSTEQNNAEIQVIGVDINDKYYAEKQKEETLRTKTFALNHAKMGSWKYNFMTRDVTLSKEMLTVLGMEEEEEYILTLEEFLEKFVPQKYHHKILNEVVKAVSSKINDQETSFSFEIIDNKKRNKWFYVSSKKIDKSTAFGIAQDITNQKLSADALSESNFRFKLLAENAEDVIFTTDKHGNITYVSPSIEKSLGFTPTEIENKHFSTLIHFEDFEKVNWKSLLPHNKESISDIIRLKILTKNQFYIWFECIIKSVIQGDEIQFICSARNINQRTSVEAEREQLLEEIKQSEELLRTVINSTPDWMYIKDTGQRYLMVNSSYAEQMQLPSSEFIGRTDLELNLPYSSKQVSPNLIADKEVLKTGITQYSFEENFQVGEKVYSMSTVRIPLFSTDQSIWGVLCIAHHISDIKEAQSKLIYKEKLLQSVADATYELIRNTELEFALKNALSKLGSNLNIANIGVYAFNHEAKLPFESTQCIVNWKGNQVNNFDKEEAIPLLTISKIYHTLENKKIYLEKTENVADKILQSYLQYNEIAFVTFVPLFVNNKLYGFVSFTNKENSSWDNTEISIFQSFTDIIAASIERKNGERDLIQAKQIAEETNTAKNSFFESTTNQLKSPLNSIIGFTDLVLKSEVSKSQKEFLNNIRSSAFDLQNMLNNIVDYSNLEAGVLELNLSEMMLEDFMADIFDIYQLEAMEKKIQFTSYVDPSLPTKVLGDAYRIREIISHLLNNALKFTSIDDHIVLSMKSTGPIIQKNNKTYQNIEIQVKDTGIGISPKNLRNIFQFLSQNEIAQKNKGLGLGLTISKRLAELMNGELSVDSEMGKGASFTLNIELEVLVKDPLYINNLPLGIEKALIVQPNRFTAQYIQETLAYFNINAIHTDDIEEAILYLTEDKSIKLVFIDQYIHSNNGVEFAQRLNEELDYPYHQMIMMVPNLEVNLYETQYNGIGITNILAKPIKTYELYGMIFSASMQNANETEYTTEVHKAQIMVVEDDEMSRVLIQKVLNGLGFDVITLNSGKDCLDQITINEPVLIFMDLHLPVMDGFTTSRLIRKLKSPYSNIPIVGISETETLDDRQKCVEVGINDIILKPYRYEDIVKILKKRTLLV